MSRRNAQSTAGSLLVSSPVAHLVLLFVSGLATARIHSILGLAVLGGGAILLALLHRKDPANVVGILFAVATMVPLMRRIHDLYHGFTPGSPILMASYLAYPAVAFICIPRLHLLRGSAFIPVVFALAGLILSYCVGVLSFGLVQSSIQLLQYIAGPIVFCFVLMNGESLDTTKLARWFLGLGFVAACYGLYQWASPPPWDVAWFIGADMHTAGGKPLPFMMRTFGTLNSGSPYSYFMFYCAVVSASLPMYAWFAAPMYAALATTLGRAAWGATALGIAIGIVFGKGAGRTRLLVSILATTAALGLLAIPFPDRVSAFAERFNTVKDLKQDNSFKDRNALLKAAFDAGAFNSPLGAGLGGAGAAARLGGSGIEGIDNGFLQTLWLFGWWGSLLYLGGFIVILVRGYANMSLLDHKDVMFLASATSLFAANLFESAFDDIKGVMVWVSLSVVSVAIRRGNAPRRRSSRA